MGAAARSVAVAMSGGVDSSVAALLLKRAGWHVTGVFMSNWDEREERGICTSEDDYRMVTNVCEQIGVPAQRVSFVKEYWNDVFSDFLDSYKEGYTPNPDILCNQKIKFGVFYKHVMTSLGVDKMATGHYAQTQTSSDGVVRLLQGVDKTKDQTFFLSTVSQSMLKDTLFPVGGLTKKEVRDIAMKAGLQRVARKKESMDLCFVGERKFRDFIAQYIEEKEGYFVDVENGKVIGRQKGHHLYTIGQRARIGGLSEAYYVVDKENNSNKVLLAKGRDHPALYTHRFTTAVPSWIAGTPPPALLHEGELTCTLRYRHLSPLTLCKITMASGSLGLQVTSATPLRAVTPGQYAVLYNGDECMGGACINRTEPNDVIRNIQRATKQAINS